MITPVGTPKMIDLHCHLLPGIDDGPKTMAQALDMARYAVEQGIGRCVVTPHIEPGCYDNDKASISKVFAAYKEQLEYYDISLQIGMAAEVRICAELPQMILEEKIPFLGQWQGRNVLLLEFPHQHITLGADNLIRWLCDKDIQPVIAHPERNQTLIRQPDKLKPFLESGCLMQITAGSITGVFGTDSQRYAMRLIDEGYATLIASDAHNLQKRPPSLRKAWEYLMPSIGELACQTLMYSNPLSMLA